VELAPLSLPANEPVTEAVPPLLGNTNPTSPALLDSMLWPENVTVLFAIELGIHRAVHVEEVGVLAAPRAEQALEARENVKVEVAPVTAETFDPLVVQLEAAIVTVTVSELVPPFCSGGSKVTVPLPEQVTVPVAMAIAAVDELVEGEPLVVDVEVLGLEEQAASAKEMAKPARRNLAMRWIFPPAAIGTDASTESCMY